MQAMHASTLYKQQNEYFVEDMKCTNSHDDFHRLASLPVSDNYYKDQHLHRQRHLMVEIDQKLKNGFVLLFVL